MLTCDSWMVTPDSPRSRTRRECGRFSRSTGLWLLMSGWSSVSVSNPGSTPLAFIWFVSLVAQVCLLSTWEQEYGLQLTVQDPGQGRGCQDDWYLWMAAWSSQDPPGFPDQEVLEGREDPRGVQGDLENTDVDLKIIMKNLRYSRPS